jgi:hypothetical protein
MDCSLNFILQSCRVAEFEFRFALLDIVCVCDISKKNQQIVGIIFC